MKKKRSAHDRPVKPHEYAVADTPALCEAMGLPWRDGGYGLLFCTDVDGYRWTFVTEDTDYHRMLIEACDAGVLGGDVLPAGKYPLKRAGWPDEWGNRYR